MGREVVLKRLEVLEERARFYRWVAAAFTLGVVTSGALLGEGVRSTILALISYAIAVAAGIRAYRLETYIEEKWEEVLREDPRWLKRDALTLVVMATIALAGVLLARLLGG